MSDDNNERRDFLKMAGATVAGITISTIAGGDAAAAPMMRGQGTRTVMLHCKEGVTLKSIHEAMAQAIRPFGCPGCGLLGVDLHFHLGDPEPFNVDVPGIRATSF